MQKYKVTVIINGNVVFTTQTSEEYIADVFALISNNYNLDELSDDTDFSIVAKPI